MRCWYLPNQYVANFSLVLVFHCTEIMFFYSENDKTDLDVIRENHRFLWREDDEADMNWYLELLHKTVILDHFVPSL